MRRSSTSSRGSANEPTKLPSHEEGETLKSQGIYHIYDGQRAHGYEEEDAGSVVDCNKYSQNVKQVWFEDDEEPDVFHKSHYSRNH